MEELLPKLPNVSQEEFDSLPTDEKFLTAGAYGTVVRALWCGQDVAVKSYNSTNSALSNRKELQNLRLCNHRNVVRILAAGPDIENGNVDFLILEFAPCGSLESFLQQGTPYTFFHAINWMKQVASGTAYLHTQLDLCHRDIKPNNLLLFDYGLLVKVCDFGTAKRLEEENTSQVGTARYMAPEVMDEMRPMIAYNKKCDVYSYACIFWEVLTRVKPYEHANCFSQLQLCASRGERPINGCPRILWKLLQCSWKRTPNDRPTIQQVVSFLNVAFRKMGPKTLDKLPFKPRDPIPYNSLTNTVPPLLGDGESFKCYRDHLKLARHYTGLQNQIELNTKQIENCWQRIATLLEETKNENEIDATCERIEEYCDLRWQLARVMASLNELNKTVRPNHQLNK